LVDAALGLTAAPSDAPWIIQPKWIREVLVSLTITNPVATKTLLEFLIAKKERALPEFVAILQRPTTLRELTPTLPTGCITSSAPTAVLSAPTGPLMRAQNSRHDAVGDKDTVTPIDQATDLQTLLPQATLTLLRDSGHIPQNRGPRFV